jgi:hypothetical protein
MNDDLTKMASIARSQVEAELLIPFVVRPFAFNHAIVRMLLKSKLFI